MNILKKNIAPITDSAWKEIQEQAESIIKQFHTARQFVDIDGPNGMEMAGVSTGRVAVPKTSKKHNVNFGIREFMPLVEIRKPFELNLWELDNVDRGAKDADLSPLEDAAREFAKFEDDAIYNGFKAAGIEGLKSSAEHKGVDTSNDIDDFLKNVGSQVVELKQEGVEGPYILIVNDRKWQSLLSLAKGYPVVKQLEEILNGRIVVSQNVDDYLLLSARSGDYELVIGQDTSIGYDGHDSEKVKLYFTESFTFRVLSPEAIRILHNPN